MICVRLSFVPEDRLGMGLVGNMDITDNMMLSYKKGHSLFVDRKNPKDLAENIIQSLEVVTPGRASLRFASFLAVMFKKYLLAERLL